MSWARGLFLFIGLGPACTPAPPPESPGAAAPATRPASLPAGHSTSTAAVGLDALFVPPDPLPEIVAEVDGEPIRRDAFIHELRQMQIQFSATGIPTAFGRREILQGALDRSVEHVLRRKLADDLGVIVDPKAVAAWQRRVEARMKAEPAFRAFLLRAGKDRDQRAIDARRQILMEGIVNVVREEVQGELRDRAFDYYRRHPQDYVEHPGVEVWKIFVKAPRGMVQRDRDLARARAVDIHRRAQKNPKSFRNLAISHSEGGKAKGGGYLGFVPKGALSPDLEAQIHSAERGSVLPLWEDAEGFAIYKVGERRTGRTVPFEEVREAIVQRIYGPLVRQQVDQRIKALRAAKPVTVQIPMLKANMKG